MVHSGVHSGGPSRRPLGGSRGGRAPAYVAAYAALHDLELATYPSAEAQVAALADDIAYTSHDLDDGLRAGLFELQDLAALPLIGAILRRVTARYPGLETPRLIHEALRRLIDAMVTDLVDETSRRLDALQPAAVEGIRAAEGPVVGFSPKVETALQGLRRFLQEHMYSHDKVMRMARKARQVVRELFEGLHEQPDRLPPDWRARAQPGDDARVVEAIADYIAGMTDRFALDEHARLFNLTSRAP